MEDKERSPEELSPEESTGRGLVFPDFNLGKTWRGPEEALKQFNAEVDEIADKYPEITDGYTTVRGNQLRIEDYRPPRHYDAGRHRDNPHRGRKTYPSTRRESYQESQQDQQDRRSY